MTTLIVCLGPLMFTICVYFSNYAVQYYIIGQNRQNMHVHAGQVE
jgi:hypothetical protein